MYYRRERETDDDDDDDDHALCTRSQSFYGLWVSRAQGEMGRTAFAAKDIFNALVYLYRSIPIIDRSVMEEEIMHEHLCCYVYFVGHLHAYLYVTDW
jgi:hypothetical protein